MMLLRYDACPIGRVFEPGSIRCQDCVHYREKEWIAHGNEGTWETKCVVDETGAVLTREEERA